MPSTRMVPAAVLAAVAGAVTAVQLLAPQFVIATAGTVGLLGILLPVLSLLSLSASPVGVVLAGYYWGAGAAVRRRWPTLLGVLAAAAFGGFLATFLVLGVAIVLLGDHANALAVFGQVVYALGLVDVALAGLAGAAVGEFRAEETGNSSTAPA